MNIKFLHFLFLIILLFAGFDAKSQLKVGDNPTTINASSVLEIESTNKGLRIPRLALTNITAATPLAAHVEGMVIYNTATINNVSEGMYYNDGTKWIRVVANATGEILNIYNGNGTLTGARTVAMAANTLGFTSAATTGTSHFYVSNATTPLFNVDAVNNRVGVGLWAPEERFHVVGGISRFNSNSTTALYVADNTNAPAFVVNGTSKRVAINQWAADAELDVNGQVKIRGGVPGAGKVLTSDATGLASWVTPTAGTTYAAGTGLSLTGTTFAHAAHTGDVTGTTALTIADNAVTTTKIANANVTTAKIADNAVTTAKITDANITTAKLADASVTAVKLNSMGATSGQVLKWNGTVWAPAADANSADNIYTSNGTLTGARTVAMAANTLGFTSAATTGTSHFYVSNATTPLFNVDAVNNRVGVGLWAPEERFHVVGGISRFNSNSTTALYVADNTNAPAFVVNGTSKRVAINQWAADAALDINGQVKIRGGAPGAGKVLTSDATGLASWVTPTAGATYAAGTGLSLTGTTFAHAAHTGDVTGTTALTIADNAVTTTKIANANVTTAKIADANVTTVKVADNAVTTAKIADANITTAKLADASVTAVKLNAMGATSGQVLKWNGTVWAPSTDLSSADNIYTANGTLSGARTVTMGNNNLSFLSAATTGTSHFSVSTSTLPIFNVDAVNGRTGIGLWAPLERFHVVGGNSRFNANSTTALFVSDATNAPAFVVNATDKRVAINQWAADAALDVNGQVKIRGGAPGAGKVLTSDATGLASWVTPTAGATYTAGTGLSLTGTTFAHAAHTGDVTGTTALTIADNAVTTTKIANANVTTAKIADANITTAKIADASVTAAKLNAMGATSGQVLKWNGTVWAPAADANSADNIYTSNGTLTGARTVAMATNALGFTSSATAGTSHFYVSNATTPLFNVDAVNNRVGVGLWAPEERFHVVGGVSRFNSNSTTALYVADNANAPAFVVNGTAKRVAINQWAADAALDINGQVKIRGGAPGAGKVLTSDATGLATWETLSAGTTYTAGTGLSLTGTTFAHTAHTGDVTGTTTLTISDNAVTTTKIANANVTTAKIADGNVTTAKIADASVTAAKLNAMGATSGQVLKWNGTTWAPAADANNLDNIYTSNGTLTGARTVTMSTNALGFTSAATTGTSHFYVSNATTPLFNVDAVNNRVGVGLWAPLERFHVYGGNSRFNAASTSALYVADLANSPAFVVDATNKRIGIGQWSPTEALDVNGKAKIRTVGPKSSTALPVFVESDGTLTKGPSPFVPFVCLSVRGATSGQNWASNGPVTDMYYDFTDVNFNNGYNSSNYTYTIPATGIYQVSGSVRYSVSNNSNNLTLFVRNYTQNYLTAIAQIPNVQAGVDINLSGSYTLLLSQNDVISLAVQPCFGCTGSATYASNLRLFNVVQLVKF